jgi:hypothetical protein
MYLHKNEVSQILTKYYYKNSQLCYQILVQTTDGSTHVVEDLSSYTDYKRAVAQIESKLNSGTVIETKQYCTEKSMLGAVA